MREGVGYVGIVIGFVLLLVVGWLGFYVFSWVTAPASGRLEMRQQVNSGSYRIASYEQFFDECASIQGIESSIEISKAQLATADSSREKDRIETNLTALGIARADAIAQYNADSAKAATRAQFKASDLPYSISLTPYRGVVTICTAG